MLIFIISLCLFVIVMCYWVFIHSPRSMVIRNVTLPMKIDQDYTIAFFSDIHFTAYNFDYRSRHILDAIDSIQPDIILFGGDLIDKQWLDNDFLVRLKGFLSALEAKHGVYGVLGNHDACYVTHQTYEAFMRGCGIQTLNNEIEVIEDLQLAIGGVEDALFGHPDKFLFQTRIQPIQILMCHEPDALDEMNLKQVDLALSGHTHGGQIRLPIITRFVLPKLGKRYIKGMYHLANTILYVSSGIGGALFSARFRNTPEVIRIHITKTTL